MECGYEVVGRWGSYAGLGMDILMHFLEGLLLLSDTLRLSSDNADTSSDLTHRRSISTQVGSTRPDAPTRRVVDLLHDLPLAERSALEAGGHLAVVSHA